MTNRYEEVGLARRIFLFSVGLFECGMFGGMIFGWPQLVFLLKEEGIFGDLCDEEDILKTEREVTTNFSLHDHHVVDICPAQEKMFSLCFTVSMVCYALPSVLAGYYLHIAGLWIMRFTTSIMFIVSFILFAFLSKESPYLLLPALVLLTFGGNQTRIASLQLGDLFPDRRSTAITLMMGSCSISSSVFLLFQVLVDAGVTRFALSWGMVVISCASFFCTFAFPTRHISQLKLAGITTQSANEDTVSNKPQDQIPLKTSFCTLTSLLHSYWLMISLFGINNYNQMFNFWVTENSGDAQEIKRYTSIFSFCGILGAFTSPLLGVLADFMLHRSRKTSDNDPLNDKVDEVRSLFLPLLINTICSMGLFACLLFSSQFAMYLSLCFLIVCRSGIFSAGTALLRARFPSLHLDRLVGIYGTFSGVTLFLQYPFFQWALNYYNVAIIFGFILTCVGLSYPLHLLPRRMLRKALKKQQISNKETEEISILKS